MERETPAIRLMSEPFTTGYTYCRRHKTSGRRVPVDTVLRMHFHAGLEGDWFPS